ncbi:MAG: T9SS type A sorting domain-containing protein [Saprospiraceae bacterium]|nr:T9SS type A sorting domain-containing protein [Saprospiraceae bacterium]
MIKKIIGSAIFFILLFATGYSGIYAQTQSTRILLNQNGIQSVRLLDSTRLENARIKSNYVQLQQNFLLTDSAGLEIVLSDSCILSTEIDISLEFSADTFIYHIMDGDILDSDEIVITSSNLEVGDTIEFARSEYYIYLIHNSVVLDYFAFTSADTILRTALKVNAANNCHLELKVKELTIPPVDTSVFEFLDTLLIVAEGDSVGPYLLRTSGSTNASIDIALITDSTPHFDNYSTINRVFSISDTLYYSFLTDSINGLNDENDSYIFELTTLSPYSIIGPRSRLHVVVVDDIQDSLTAINPAGIIITAVDNQVDDLDRVSLTNLTPIYPNTSFSIANALYEKVSNGHGRWYGSSAIKSPNIASQKITYTGSSTLPIGSVICFDIPSTGTGPALFVKDFEINGITSSDFTIENDGNVADPDISLSIEHPEALFLMQGSWDFNSEYGEFFGSVLHGVQIGSDWLDDLFINPTYISDKPEDIACFTADWGGSLKIATYYNCDNGYSETSTLTIMSEISQAANWVFEIPTTALDLPTNICQMQCDIEVLDTFWYISVKDLIIPCEDASNYQNLVDDWLNSYGNGAAFSSCGIISITNNYDSLTLVCGTSTMTEVIFTATDSCSHSFADTGLIIITDTIAPIWTSAPEPLTLFCIDSTIADSLINHWLSGFGGGLVFDACNSVVIVNDYNPQQLICDSILTVTFTATDDCGNQQIEQSYIEIQDDVPPVFITYPHNLFLSCDGGYDIQDTIAYWLGEFGYASTMDECSNVTTYFLIPPGLDSISCPVDTSIQVSFFIRDDCYNYAKADAYIYIRSSTDTCDTNIFLEQDSNVLVVKDFDCSGVRFMNWEYQTVGDSTWTFITLTQDTILPPVLGQGTYRVTTSCHGECPDTLEIYYPVCDSLSMAIEDSAIGLKWGTLLYGSQPVTNYLISWVDESGEEVFRSAAGVYYDTTTLPHPLPVFQPVLPGKYLPIILASDFGNYLTCFDSATVEPLECGNDYSFDYDGVGGIIASHEAEFEITDSTWLKFWFQTKFGPIGNPDRLLVVYDGDTLLNTGFILWDDPHFRMVRVNHVTGVDRVKIFIENQGSPNTITKYIMKVKCCDAYMDCDSLSLGSQEYGSIIASGTPGSCSITPVPDTTWTHEYFWDHYCLDLDILEVPTNLNLNSNRTVCATGSSVFATCTDGDSIVVSNLASEGYSSGIGFVLNFSTDMSSYYSNLKNKLQAIESDSNRYVNLTFNEYTCIDDEDPKYTVFFLIPLASEITFDDDDHKIIYVLDSINPYDSATFNCSGSMKGIYNILNSKFSYNSSDTIFDSYGSIFISRQSTIQSNFFAGNGTTTHKTFTNDSCTIQRTIALSALDYECACDTWVLKENGITIDSGGSTSCPIPDFAHQSSEITYLPDDYFKIYPNPTRGVLKIDFINPIGEDITIAVLDLNGRLIKQQKYLAIKGFNTTEIDMNETPVGMYILNLHGQSQTNSDRFILMR